jgi:hypothetical protein
MMATHRYPNLTIIEDTDIGTEQAAIFTRAIIAKPLPSITDDISHQSIRDAIHQQYQVDMRTEDISKFGTDYIIRPQTSEISSHILSGNYLRVKSYTLTLIPWNPYYNAIIVPIETQTNSNQIDNQRATDYTAQHRSEHLTIDICGIPPHLCSNSVVTRLFSEPYIIESISFSPATLGYTVKVYGPEVLVPNVAHLALKKRTQRGDLLNIWPLWYETYTQEMLGRLSPPTYDRVSSLHGGKSPRIYDYPTAKHKSKQ